ncbi:uncharacterized protein RAG0_07132 [Rhynchosporium agropyri]|uniref:Uncharacterized protein n=1 Tax=Rhynchosporium agropyri TaxID=914238 RepID=A0A1E1KJY7_9HELO|nr:uncharacterized protein RAG0_07132 [Rhynchosporium agropyri]
MASDKSKLQDSGKTNRPEKSKKSSKKTPPPATYKSTEFVQDSDEEVEKDSSKTADERSDEASNSDAFSSSTKSVNGASKTNGRLPAPEGSSSSNEGESADSDESSEDEEESEDATSKAPVAIEPIKQPPTQPISHTVAPKTPYQPPPGFDLASIEGVLDVSQKLKNSSLEGKQIWYFTAPASVPIGSIKAMNLLDAKSGKTVLTYDGDDYGFLKDTVEDTIYTRIMVPSSNAGYKATSKSIDQVFHLQQVAREPTTVHPTRATIPAKKPIRQQPRGLKMRFHPVGFGDAQPGTIGSSSSDEEMEDAPSREPRSVSKSKLTNYSGDGASDEEMAESVLPTRPHPDNVTSSANAGSKKEKKRKHREDGEKKSKHTANTCSHQPKYSARKSKPAKEERSSSMTPSSISDPSLKDSRRATDPRLTEDERRKKMKKLKHHDATRQKGSAA